MAPAPGLDIRIASYGPPSADCAQQKTGCETFGGGRWAPGPNCGAKKGTPESGGLGKIFVPPVRRCVDPLPGEAPGQSPGGKVCTWQSISGSTEEGRSFEDYASCDLVRSQGRPYYPYPVAENAEREDPRMQDPIYVKELEWVKTQIRASSCGCCHSNKAPKGPSNWYIEQKGNFINGFFDRGLTFGSHWVDSSAFGAYDPEQNNGFERVISGFPSVDGPRMRAFFERELEHRGLRPEDFANDPPFGGPLHKQRVYEPGPCPTGIGVDREGKIHWEGGPARYVYLLAPGSQGPIAPPKLDLPEGTHWRVDVPPTAAPVASGSLRYGVASPPLKQAHPRSGAPIALQPGSQYYLYVTRDVIMPITRCLFTY